MGVFDRQRKNGLVYYVSFMVDGEQVFEKAGTDKREAERLYRRRKREVADGTYVRKPKRGSAKRFSMPRFANEFIRLRRQRIPPIRTIEDEVGRIENHIVPFWEERSVLSLTDDDVREFLAATRKKRNDHTGKQLSENTVVNVFSTLSQLFDEAERQARKQGMNWANPCKLLRPIERPRRVQRPRDYYRRDEVEALTADERIPLDRRVFYTWLFLTGMRHDEVAGLRVSDIDWTASPLPRVRLASQADRQPLKEDKRNVGLWRDIPVHPALQAIVREWLEEGFEQMYLRPPKPSDYLIPATSRVDRLRPKRTTLKQIKRDAKLVGITTRTTHETRNTFLTLANEDAPELESIIDRITHQPESGRASETYKRSFWLAQCRAVQRLELGKRILAKAQPAPSTDESAIPDASLHDVSHDVRETEDKSPAKCGASGGADGTRTRQARRKAWDCKGIRGTAPRRHPPNRRGFRGRGVRRRSRPAAPVLELRRAPRGAPVLRRVSPSVVRRVASRHAEPIGQLRAPRSDLPLARGGHRRRPDDRRALRVRREGSRSPGHSRSGRYRAARGRRDPSRPQPVAVSRLRVAALLPHGMNPVPVLVVGDGHQVDLSVDGEVIALDQQLDDLRPVVGNVAAVAGVFAGRQAHGLALYGDSVEVERLVQPSSVAHSVEEDLGHPHIVAGYGPGTVCLHALQVLGVLVGTGEGIGRQLLCGLLQVEPEAHRALPTSPRLEEVDGRNTHILGPAEVGRLR
jgi:integrase